VVWGVTPRTARLAEQLGLSEHFPAVDIVREVNDKRYSHLLEKKLGIDLPQCALIDSVQAFEARVRTCPFDWVLKHPLGVSARERVVGRQGKILPSAHGWARNRLKEGWTLVFEPWVENCRNASLHFEILPGGESRFLGHCHLLTDLGGVYRGNLVTPTDPLPALEAARQIVNEVAEKGYWGLVGIDTFSGTLAGQPLERPLVEINARCSFGRLTLALGHWIPAGWSYLWWHPRQADAGRLSAPLRALPETGSGNLETGVYRLPLSVDPEQNSGTAVLTAPTAARLESLQAQWLPQPGSREAAR
jgi:hypothetical protein